MTPSTSRSRVWVVDDSPLAAQIAFRALSAEFACETFCDGAAALERMAADGAPDVLILDWTMPGMSGLEVCRFLRATHDEFALPILMVTARREGAEAVEALSTGSNDFLPKPYSELELLARVKTLARMRRLYRLSLEAETERQRLLNAAHVARADAEAERAKLEQVFAQSPVSIAIHEGPLHTYAFANAAYRELVAGRDVVGKTLLEALPEVKAEGFDRTFDEVARTGITVRRSELPVELLRGGQLEQRWFDFVFSPKRNAAGDVDGLMQSAYDVTDQVLARRQVELYKETLRRSEEALRRALEAAGVGAGEVLVATSEFTYDLQLQAIHGLPPGGSVQLEEGMKTIHPDDRERVRKAVARSYAGADGGRYRIEYRVVWPDGSLHWLELGGRTTFDSEGRPVRLIATASVIDGRKEAELAQARLLRSIADQPVFGVAVLHGPELRFTMANPAYHQFVGGRELVGKPFLDALPEFRGQGADVLMLEVMRTGKSFTGRELGYRMERHGAGDRPAQRYFNFIWQPLASTDGAIDSVLVISQDATDAVQAREQESRHADAARERVEFEQQLIGIVSHDLRSPLGAILHGAAALARREELDARTHKSVAHIRSAAERATRLVSDLLDFTQARLGGGIRIQRRPADLHVLTRNVLGEIEASSPGRALILETAADGHGEWDPDRLTQVVENLVTNALKYSPEGTPVRVQTRGEEDRVELRVHNLGRPIPAERIAHLFEPLQRATDTLDGSRSVGLGLYIVKHLLDAHAARIEVQSTAEAGTTFTVSLPRRLSS